MYVLLAFAGEGPTGTGLFVGAYPTAAKAWEVALATSAAWEAAVEAETLTESQAYDAHYAIQAGLWPEGYEPALLGPDGQWQWMGDNSWEPAPATWGLGVGWPTPAKG